jgi:hypothetical protein
VSCVETEDDCLTHVCKLDYEKEKEFEQHVPGKSEQFIIYAAYAAKQGIVDLSLDYHNMS